MIAGLALTVLLATQGRPAPAKPMPADFPTQVQRYVEMGLADPRGGEYREVKVEVGSVWNSEGAVVATRGWIKPGTKQVVCWNGLPYEALEVGEPADFREEIAGFVKRGSAKYWSHSLAEAHNLKFGGPVAAALLLLLQDELNARLVFEAGPLADLRQQYGWHRFDRAVTRYMRAQDADALADAKIASTFLPELTQQEKKEAGPSHPKLAVQMLITELERRVENPLESFDPTATPKLSKAERIDYLIDQLENVSATQYGQPGGVLLGTDPVVLALMGEGYDAVERLFQVAESDERLTRSVSFGRDFHPDRNLIPVRAAALEALMQIMEVRVHASSGGKEGLAELRALWEKTSGKVGPERWLYILQDNQAGADAWLEASKHLTEPTNVRWLGAWTTTQTAAKTPQDTAMKGEALRSSHGMEITALIERRAKQIASEAGWESSMGEFELSKACEMAVARAKWQPDGASKLLQELFKVAQDHVLTEDNRSINGGYHLISILDWRLRLGDSSAIADYELLMKHPALVEMAERAVVPLWRHRDFPGMRKLADRLLTDSSSQWHLRSRLSPNGTFYLAGLAGSNLLILKSFRREVMELLSDKSVLHTYVRDGDRLRSGSSGIYFAPDDKLAPKLGESRDERVCDLIFSRMLFQGKDEFRVYWPNRDKDRIIAKARELIKKEDERFVSRFIGYESDPYVTDPR